METRAKTTAKAATTYSNVRQKQKFVDSEFEEELTSFVKKNRPHALTTEEKLDILLLQTHFRKEHQEKQAKNGPGQKVRKKPEVSEKTAKILHRRLQLV